jgi:hypothetical protein
VPNKELRVHISVPEWESPFFMGRLCDKTGFAGLKIPREANAEFPTTAAIFFAKGIAWAE